MCYFSLFYISASAHGNGPNEPCVGLCYYKKLLALKARNKAEMDPNEIYEVKNDTIQSYSAFGTHV